MKLILGDSISAMAELPEESIDMVMADPPYGTTQCKWDSVIPFEPMWTQLKRIVKPNGAIVLMAAQPFTSALIMSNPKMFKYTWTWKKNKSTGFLNAKKQPLRSTEDIVVFYSKPPVYNPQKTTGHKPVNSYTKHTSDGATMGATTRGFTGGGQTDRYPTNVIEIPVVNNDNSGEAKLHPTQKPVALMEYLISTYSNIGDTVLDFTMGSGSTGIACSRLDRKFIGIDNDPHWVEVSKSRFTEVGVVVA